MYSKVTHYKRYWRFLAHKGDVYGYTKTNQGGKAFCSFYIKLRQKSSQNLGSSNIAVVFLGRSVRSRTRDWQIRVQR